MKRNQSVRPEARQLISFKKVVWLIIAITSGGCGLQSQENTESRLNWIRSQPGNDRYAFLESRDLDDEFLFGGSVTGARNFISAAINMEFPILKVKLRLVFSEEGKEQLGVFPVGSNSAILAFNTRRVATEDGETMLEIDFASAGNDLRLKQAVEFVGGQTTIGDQMGYWYSESIPEVKNLSQDSDTVVVDLLHNVRQARLGQNSAGELYVDEFLTEEGGQVDVRVWLRRSPNLPEAPVWTPTKAESFARNLGFFSSGKHPPFSEEAEHSPIGRMAIGKQFPENEVTFQLKGVPFEYFDVVKEAVLSWNLGFEGNPIKVRSAPGDVGPGDPRHFVLQWLDGMDDSIGWAGVARTYRNPDTGLNMGGTIYILGSSLISAYMQDLDFSEQLAAQVEGALGQAEFVFVPGEAPVVPYLTGNALDSHEFLRSYYFNTVAHEVGHVLGLRHNFRGSTELDQNGKPSSVMDYLPLHKEGVRYGPGEYDLAALKWGYSGTESGKRFNFCTDENVYEIGDAPQYWDCHQGDYGDPVAYHLDGLFDGTEYLTKVPFKVEQGRLLRSMARVAKTAAKLWDRKNSMPEPQRVQMEQDYERALDYVYSAGPDTALDEAERENSAHNLGLLRTIVSRALNAN